MGYYIFKKEQTLNADINSVWDFVSRPENLAKITPASMNFSILSQSSPIMEEGMLIAYEISPVLNIKTTWITEITSVIKHKKFIDQQVKGPYRFWHHEHKFQEVSSSIVKMTDVITYIPPYRLIGDITNKLFLKNQLKNIFKHRSIVLNKMFNNI